MKLSKRLKASADFVTHGSKVADVGCDHAYTSIYLVKNEIADRCIAMDIKEGPLSKARENIERYECMDKIETRLSDGLKKLQPGEVDTVLISGMGGILIQKILEESKEVVSELGELILQPQSEQDKVRKYLHQIGFGISGETMLCEDGKYYVSMHAVKADEGIAKAYERKIDYLFGKILLDRKDACLLEHLKERQEKYGKIYSDMKERGRTKQDDDYREIQEKLKDIAAALEVLGCQAENE